DSGAVGIGLKLSGLDAIGAYTGTVNLPPSAAGTPVALKVRRTDGVVLPAVALIIGILLALWAQRFLGLRRTVYLLQEAEAQLAQEFAETGAPYRGYDIREDVEARLAATRATIDRLGGSGFATASAEVRKAAGDELTSLRTALVAWNSLPQLLAALDGALETLDALAAKPPAPLPPTPAGALPPAFAAGARELREGGPLTLAALVAVVAELRATVAAAAAFPAFAERTSAIWSLADRLTEHERELDDRRDELVEARGRGAGAWVQAVLADSPARLAAAKVDEQLDRGFARLARLADVFGDARVEVAGVLERAARAAATDRAPDFAEADAEAVAEGIEEIEETPEEAEDRGTQIRLKRRSREIGLTLVAILLALVSGLDSLYFGHEFGTPRDYLNALLWGFATKTALDAAATVIERVRGGAPAWRAA
ncbi:MAG TPA: hypothetical protein VGW10_07190, partial [Solirubrobacteraceae bacterium]|nr:hypothetical protein [Solirubrobacteraceae bacterium]